MRIHVKYWRKEIRWRIDDGDENDVGNGNGRAKDPSIYESSVSLEPGVHTFHAIDTAGDSWHDGYWEVIDNLTQQTVAGGAGAGKVVGKGGATSFTLGADGSGTAAPPPPTGASSSSLPPPPPPPPPPTCRFAFGETYQLNGIATIPQGGLVLALAPPAPVSLTACGDQQSGPGLFMRVGDSPHDGPFFERMAQQSGATEKGVPSRLYLLRMRVEAATPLPPLNEADQAKAPDHLTASPRAQHTLVYTDDSGVTHRFRFTLFVNNVLNLAVLKADGSAERGDHMYQYTAAV